jgi:ABC-type lipoprotein export system ATPase subunit
MPLLEIEGLVKAYRAPDGEVQTVLDVPRFAMEAGEQVALIGQSGSGKTTLLHAIAGILRPDAGSIRLDGLDLARLSESRRDAVRARQLGYVFQTFNLLQGYSALENVLLGMVFGPGADRAFARDLLVRLGLGDRLDHRPTQLSVGQQQRVALARALANRPRLVLADEPTGNLDPERAAQALGLLQSLCKEQGAALLVVTHERTVRDAFARVVDLGELNRACAPARAPGATA